MSETRYREVTVEGTPFEMGRAIGEALREEVRGFAAVALERVNRTVPVSSQRARERARACLAHAEAFSPHGVAELRGVAESSGIAFDTILLLQIRNQLLVDAGCSSLSLAPAATREAQPLVAQNWDNDPALDPFTVVLTRRPAGRPAFVNVTQAGLVAYIGCNDRGVGLCMNSLPAPARAAGVPFYFVVREIYAASSLEAVVAAAERAERAMPANLMLATPQGPADLELAIDRVAVLRPDGELLFHTNHCLHPDLAPINATQRELIQSYARHRRLERLLAGRGGPFALEDLKALLRDHDGAPRSICRHPNEDPPYGFWSTVFSVIIDTAACCLHVTRGNPCERPYELYRLGSRAVAG